jgi:hypothetical protein
VARPTPGAASPPAAALSRYAKTTNPRVTRAWGCALGRQARRHISLRDALVVLDFGRPMRIRHKFGASLFRIGFRDTDHIRWAVQAYIRGFVQCSRPVLNARLQVAIGTSNWGHQVTYHHGWRWAQMVNQTADWVAAQSLSSRISVAGASDIETTWNGPAVSRAWVRGYLTGARWPYFDYGDAGACPPYGNCAGRWTLEDVWYVSQGSPLARALPEIYTPSGANARQWFNLSLYAVRRHARPITFAGIMTQRAACRMAHDPCHGMSNSPARAWVQLQRLVNRHSATRHRIRWVTDIAG